MSTWTANAIRMTIPVTRAKAISARVLTGSNVARAPAFQAQG